MIYPDWLQTGSSGGVTQLVSGYDVILTEDMFSVELDEDNFKITIEEDEVVEICLS